MKYAHTCIRVQDLDASIRFYKEALGYKEVERKDFPEKKFTLVYMALEESPQAQLELTYNYGHGPYDLGDGYGHMALYTKDLEKVHSQLKEAEYPVTDLSGLPGQEAHYFFIQDPDGYKTEIIREK